MLINLIILSLSKFLSSFVKVIKDILVIKSTKINASFASMINSVIGIILVKIIVQVDIIPACIVAGITNFLASYCAMYIYETKIQKKDVSKDLNSRIMTIDEAIEHCKEKANEHKCDACGEDHAQLASWLTELKRLKS
jgi:hypothetical protein